MRPGWDILIGHPSRVSLCRGMDLDAAMVGCPVAEAPARAGFLHGLCPTVHRVAVTAALGQPVEPAALAALNREALALAALRFGLEWPLRLGLPPNPYAATARRFAQAGDDGALLAAVETLISPAWLDPMRQQLDQLLARQPALMARLEGQIGEATRRCTALRAGAACDLIEAGDGWAEVGSLRGPLKVHLAHDGDQVTAFTSSAPTDRLMADPGTEATLAAAPDRATLCAMLCALDPCGEVRIIEAPAPKALHHA